MAGSPADPLLSEAVVLRVGQFPMHTSIDAGGPQDPYLPKARSSVAQRETQVLRSVASVKVVGAARHVRVGNSGWEQSCPLFAGLHYGIMLRCGSLSVAGERQQGGRLTVDRASVWPRRPSAS